MGASRRVGKAIVFKKADVAGPRAIERCDIKNHTRGRRRGIGACQPRDLVKTETAGAS